MAQNISKKLSYIGENIKKIRQVKRISQAEFAGLFNLARPSVGAYEEGRSEPKIDTIIQIANYFRISIDVLLTRKLTVNEIFSLDQLKDKLDKAHNIKKGRVNTSLAASLPGIALVKLGQYVDYIVNSKNADFIQNLSQVNLPTSGSRAHRAFEMNGSEMEYRQQGLHHGDLLVGEATSLDSLNDRTGEILTVVHKNGILTRRLLTITKKNLSLSANDPNYPAIDIVVSDIIELWRIRSVFSSHLNAPSLVEERMMLLEKEVASIKKGLK